MKCAWMLCLIAAQVLAQEPGTEEQQAQIESEVAIAVAKLPLAEVERPWKQHAYPGFVESIDALVGPGAFDCGYVDTIEKRSTIEFAADVQHCVEASIAGGNAFKYGFERVAVDAHMYGVVARAPSGELWIITVFGRSEQHNQVCQSVKGWIGFDPSEQGCVERSRGSLKIK